MKKEKNYWANKKVLITGGGGFVGLNASVFFNDLGCDVTTSISPHKSKREVEDSLVSVNKKTKIVVTDLLKIDEVKSLIVGHEIILHFAARAGNLNYKSKESARLFAENIKINTNVFETASETDLEALLFVSSTDIYDNSISGILNEESPINIDWDHKIDGYRLAKWSSELASREFRRQFGLNTVVVRPANLYGPRDKFLRRDQMGFVPSILSQLLIDRKPIKIWGNGKQVRSFLYIEDFLRACGLLIEKKVYDLPVNIASGNRIELKVMAELIRNVAKKDTAIQLDESKPSGQSMRVFDTTKLKGLIGKYELVTLEDGLSKTIDFLKNIHAIK